MAKRQQDRNMPVPEGEGYKESADERTEEADNEERSVGADIVGGVG